MQKYCKEENIKILHQIFIVCEQNCLYIENVYIYMT